MDQDNSDIRRLSGIFPLLDEYNNEEQEKAMKKSERNSNSSRDNNS